MKNKGNSGKEIPEETIGRLPLYLRQLEQLKSQGKKWITSREFVEKLPGVRSSNLRKDLSYFGDYGTQGRGYSVSRLTEALKEVLELDSRKEMALVGVGQLGTALLNYPGFERWGFELSLAFDRDPELVGSRVGGVEVKDSGRIEKAVAENGIGIGLIAVPGDQAQTVTDTLVSGGVRGIANFSPVLLQTPEEVAVTQVDITSTLEALIFYS